ncbi:MAG TPA: type II secretion system protein [Aquifex aeolicus]|nr:type II secretion system protein [Aquificales bacterium]HIQ26619.1 type II secretion system protein [Aquifex aeolicus]
MQKAFANKGFSLIGALLVVLIISMTIAVIGSVFLKSQKIGKAVKTFKTTKEAAEATAQVIIQSIDKGSLTTASGCKVNCDSSETKCEITLPPDIRTGIEKSSNIKEVKAYLLKNCSVGFFKIYTIRVSATAKDGSKTTIYFIYQK